MHIRIYTCVRVCVCVCWGKRGVKTIILRVGMEKLNVMAGNLAPTICRNVLILIQCSLRCCRSDGNRIYYSGIGLVAVFQARENYSDCI